MLRHVAADRQRVMIGEAVILIDHDPAWRDRFIEQQAALSVLLQPWLAAPIEHIGSTAIVGLRAKPVVDILAPVVSLEAAHAAIPLLEQDGWLFWPDDPNRAYRLWFLRPRPDARTHHLQIVHYNDPNARALLLFRDALRADPALLHAYATLKDRLAKRYGSDRDGYSDAKSDFVRSVLHAVGSDAPSRRPVG
jgi:GrpB-like predicted nucleotidyltransferase (UPF0157 family)